MLVWAALAAGCGPVAYGPEPTSAGVVVVTVPPSRSATSATITSGPFGAGQVWSGNYDCPQGNTALKLIVLEAYDYNVRALFDFYHAPSGAKGMYVIDGVLDPRSGKVRFRPVAWVVRPENYVMVGLAGTVAADADRISGRITDLSCGDFDVQLEPHR